MGAIEIFDILCICSGRLVIFLTEILVFSFAHLGDGENSWITDKCPTTPTTTTTLDILHQPFITPALYYTGPILHQP